MSKTLLIVDVQRGFINAHTQHIPHRIECVLDHYDTVIATQFYSTQNSPYDRWMNGWSLSKKSADFLMSMSLPVNAHIVEKKNRYSCVNKRFVKWLNRMNIKDMDICGIDTDACVLKCATDLFEAGILPVVLVDLCASTGGPEAHHHGIENLKRLIGASQIRYSRS